MKTKNKEKTNITVQKLCVNGGAVGKYQWQIEVVVGNRDDCDCFGGNGHYDSRGGHEDHHGHQNRWSGSCHYDRDQWCPDDGMMRCTFEIGAEKEDSHPGAAIA
uniref:Uncharacterized protein n=1 Tax=Romanomermis culicivorax TaxID=13658 RepID=A0A915ICX0_ROMCU